MEKFQEVFDKAIIQDKSREMLAVENLTLETDAASIVRLCKDLLLITRGLRETWCLGLMQVGQPRIPKEETDLVFAKFNALTERIAALSA